MTPIEKLRLARKGHYAAGFTAAEVEALMLNMRDACVRECGRAFTAEEVSLAAAGAATLGIVAHRISLLKASDL